MNNEIVIGPMFIVKIEHEKILNFILFKNSNENSNETSFFSPMTLTMMKCENSHLLGKSKEIDTYR